MIVKIVVRTVGLHRKPRRTSDISGLVRGNEFALTLRRSTPRFLVEVKLRGGRSSRSRANANKRKNRREGRNHLAVESSNRTLIGWLELFPGRIIELRDRNRGSNDWRID